MVVGRGEGRRSRKSGTSVRNQKVTENTETVTNSSDWSLSLQGVKPCQTTQEDYSVVTHCHLHIGKS